MFTCILQFFSVFPFSSPFLSFITSTWTLETQRSRFRSGSHCLLAQCFWSELLHLPGLNSIHEMDTEVVQYHHRIIERIKTEHKKTCLHCPPQSLHYKFSFHTPIFPDLEYSCSTTKLPNISTFAEHLIYYIAITSASNHILPQAASRLLYSKNVPISIVNSLMTEDNFIG